ncbi:MAG: hypothetical protein NZ602_05770 [Thermoguttaceae bacterium]|nr:hypothetical protein [Thermoguttaceae bacterium]MDW8037497.1 hypothetical protein [Thermoguttaceae bacterium]
MPRKILNRKELRQQAEAQEVSANRTEQTPAQELALPQPPSPTLPKPTKRSKKAEKEVRLKAFWGVFNQNLRRVALFEYSERKLADKKAEELTQSTKTPHFVQLVKEVIQE